MPHPRLDPRRRCMPIAEWPHAHQDAWYRAIASVDPFESGGEAAHWSEATRHKNRRGYGRWLTFCELNGWLDRAALPAEIVTVQRLRPYVAELRATVSPYTVMGRLCELHATLSAMAPATDLKWLNRGISNLRNLGVDGRDKTDRLRPTRELFRSGLAHMDHVETRLDYSPYRRAWQFQRGLMLAFLAAQPLRRTNFASIVLGQHLRRIGREYEVVFHRNEPKNRIALKFLLPDELVPYLEKFLKKHREHLITRQIDNGGLWVGRGGKPITDIAAYHIVSEITQERLGTRINPHLFRDAAATSIAVEDPKGVALIPTILGHTTGVTARRYYIHIRSLEASRRLQTCLLKRRLEAKRKIK